MKRVLSVCLSCFVFNKHQRTQVTIQCCKQWLQFFASLSAVFLLRWCALENVRYDLLEHHTLKSTSSYFKLKLVSHLFTVPHTPVDSHVTRQGHPDVTETQPVCLSVSLLRQQLIREDVGASEQHSGQGEGARQGERRRERRSGDRRREGGGEEEEESNGRQAAGVLQPGESGRSQKEAHLTDRQVEERQSDGACMKKWDSERGEE